MRLTAFYHIHQTALIHVNTNIILNVGEMHLRWLKTDNSTKILKCKKFTIYSYKKKGWGLLVIYHEPNQYMLAKLFNKSTQT